MWEINEDDWTIARFEGKFSGVENWVYLLAPTQFNPEVRKVMCCVFQAGQDDGEQMAQRRFREALGVYGV